MTKLSVCCCTNVETKYEQFVSRSTVRFCECAVKNFHTPYRTVVSITYKNNFAVFVYVFHGLYLENESL